MIQFPILRYSSLRDRPPDSLLPNLWYFFSFLKLFKRLAGRRIVPLDWVYRHPPTFPSFWYVQVAIVVFMPKYFLYNSLFTILKQSHLKPILSKNKSYKRIYTFLPWYQSLLKPKVYCILFYSIRYTIYSGLLKPWKWKNFLDS